MKNFVLAFFVTLLLVFFSASTLAQLPPLAPLKHTPEPKPPKDPHKFTFILAGDNRPENAMCKDDKDKDKSGKEKPCPPTAAVVEIFKQIKKQSPAFVLWTGDIIAGKDPDTGILHTEYREFLDVARTGDAAVFNAPGNHEMNTKNNCPDTKTLLPAYLKDTDQKAPYGSFDYGDSHFIALNSDEDTPTTSDLCNCTKFPKPASPPGYIGAAQMQMLADDLAANKNKDHIFIFLHRPLEAYKSDDQLCSGNVSAMQALFKQYPNVSYVVAGHEHMYYNPQATTAEAKFYDPPPAHTPSSSGPFYLVSGGAGAPLKSFELNGKKTKSFYHYLIFTVDKATVNVEVKKVKVKKNTKAEDDN
jgi:3',5'-cyclic AMP phosphodiesterase CpdA